MRSPNFLGVLCSWNSEVPDLTSTSDHISKLKLSAWKASGGDKSKAPPPWERGVSPVRAPVWASPLWGTNEGALTRGAQPLHVQAGLFAGMGWAGLLVELKQLCWGGWNLPEVGVDGQNDVEWNGESCPGLWGTQGAAVPLVRVPGLGGTAGGHCRLGVSSEPPWARLSVVPVPRLRVPRVFQVSHTGLAVGDRGLWALTKLQPRSSSSAAWGAAGGKNQDRVFCVLGTCVPGPVCSLQAEFWGFKRCPKWLNSGVNAQSSITNTC